MFSDRQKPKAMNEIGGQPNRREKNTKIKGDIISEADFRIDGKLDGNVKTSGKVVIGKDGYIHGKVECVNADIEGSFNGELLVSDLLSLKSSAVIEGTVSVSKLAVEPGATFKIPQGFVLKPMEKDGELFTTKNGDIRMKFTWPAS